MTVFHYKGTHFLWENIIINVISYKKSRDLLDSGFAQYRAFWGIKRQDCLLICSMRSIFAVNMILNKNYQYFFICSIV